MSARLPRTYTDAFTGAPGAAAGGVTRTASSRPGRKSEPGGSGAQPMWVSPQRQATQAGPQTTSGTQNQPMRRSKPQRP